MSAVLTCRWYSEVPWTGLVYQTSDWAGLPKHYSGGGL